jgi:type VI secretion system protein ImpH
VRESLREEGVRFEFFQAVRLLQQLAEDREAVGGDASPDREAVRFRSDVRMTFRPSDVTGIEVPEREEDGPATVTVPFFGAASPASYGSLPTCYSELILERARVHDGVFHEFVDLFNHRLLSLFYRAFEKHRFPIVWERSDAADGGLFEHVVYSVLGMNTPGLRGRMPLPDLALLPWAGALARRPVSASELEAMVQDLFDVPVEAVPFMPAWYAVDEEELAPLGKGARLGRDVFLGRSVCVGQFRFRLRLGPVPLSTYRRFLPDGEAFRSLGDLIRLATGTEFDFEIQLVLQREEVPEFRLDTDAERGNRLGWSSWLHTRPLGHDPEDVVVVGSAPRTTIASHEE